MKETTNNWAESWASSQQALMKSIFPIEAAGKSGTAGETSPLQQQFNELHETWHQSIAKWTDLLQVEPAAPITPETLKELFSPAQWGGTATGSLDAGLRHLLEGPKYATLFDLDRKLLELQQLASRRDQDVAAFQRIVLGSWNIAFERFSTELNKDGAPSSTWRAMADRWLDVVNDTLIESQRSEAFVEAQTKMVRSAADYRLQERKIAEAWCEAFHVPTRTEMDEIQRTVTDLRRKLRALHRASSSAVNTSQAVTTPRRKRKTSTKASSPHRS